MKRLTAPVRSLVLLALAASVVVASAGLVQAEGGAFSPLATGFNLPWYTVDGGGGTFSTGGGYSLGGTAGQADAGVLGGSPFAIAGGFWGAATEYRLFLPVVFRSN